MLAVAARNAGHLVAILIPDSALAEKLAGILAGFFGPEVPLMLVMGGSKKKLDFSADSIFICTTAPRIVVFIHSQRQKELSGPTPTHCAASARNAYYHSS